MRHNAISWFVLGRDALVLVLASGGAIALWRRKRSASVWPAVFGKVESASSYEDDLVWRTDIAYSYCVESNFYSGQFQLRSRSEKKAVLQEQKWRGQSIRVRYSPRDANISVVRTEDQAGLFEGGN